MRLIKLILVDRTGLTIASVSKFSYFPADVDGIFYQNKRSVISRAFCEELIRFFIRNIFKVEL